MKRVIYIEPEIENKDIIEFFKKYNPDSRFVNPHICLVFPFNSDLKFDYIKDIMDEILNEINLFELNLSGISVSYEEKNNFVFLNVDDEDKKLNQMSKLLYQRLSGYAVLKGEFIPHITIGKNTSVDEINKIKNEAKQRLKYTYNCQIKSVKSSIMVLDKENNVTLQEENIVQLPPKIRKHL